MCTHMRMDIQTFLALLAASFTKCQTINTFLYKHSSLWNSQRKPPPWCVVVNGKGSLCLRIPQVNISGSWQGSVLECKMTVTATITAIRITKLTLHELNWLL